MGQLSIWLQIFELQTTQEKPYRLLFCLELSLFRSTDQQDVLIIICIHYLIVSNPDREDGGGDLCVFSEIESFSFTPFDFRLFLHQFLE